GYEEARGRIDRESTYSPVQAVRMLKEFPGVKFDETVEVHFRLGLNVRHADEQLRGTLMLPHGTGRETRVAVFAEGDKAREAEEAGAGGRGGMRRDRGGRDGEQAGQVGGWGGGRGRADNVGGVQAGEGGEPFGWGEEAGGGWARGVVCRTLAQPDEHSVNKPLKG